MVRTWAHRGLLPVWVVPDAGWTVVLPAGPGLSDPPYDDPIALLGGRPLPARLRPALCLVADGPRAMIAAQDGARRPIQRWLVWHRGAGLQPATDDLPSLSIARLVELTSAQPAATPSVTPPLDRYEALRAALATDQRSGSVVLDDVLRALDLPGAGLTLAAVQSGDLVGAVRIDPNERVVARFDAFVAHEAALTAQLEVP